MDYLKKHQSRILLGLLFILLLGLSFLLFYRLGVRAYIDWDESIYAQVAKEAFLSGKYFDLTYFGVPWYEKPPIGILIIATSYAIGGISEWAGRAPSVIATIAMIVLSLRWVYEIHKSYLAIYLTFTFCLIMFPLITNAYVLNLDSMVGLFGLVTLYSWWKTQQKDQIGASKWFIVWGIAVGLGVMTKSIVGFFPLIPIFFYCLGSRNFAFLKDRQFWYGILFAFLLIGPWHIYQSISVGNPFWNNYFFYHIIQRYSTSLETNGAPFLYYFNLIFMQYKLSALIFGSGILASIILSWKDRNVRYLLVAASVLFLIFSSSITKGPYYIVMVLPLIIMLAGLSATRLISLIPKNWAIVLVVATLLASLGYNVYEFNNYKVAKGEFLNIYYQNRKVGEFLRNYRVELPVYVNSDYKSLGIGYYAERALIPTTDTTLISEATERVFHQKDQEVFIGTLEDGKDYLMIKKY